MGSQKTKKLGKMKIVEAWFLQLQRTRTLIGKQEGLFVCVRTHARVHVRLCLIKNLTTFCMCPEGLNLRN